MKRLFSFACTLMMFGSMAAWANPPGMFMESAAAQREREVSASAYASHCGYNEITEIWRCRSFNIQAFSNKQGGYEETRINVYQSVNAPLYSGWRYVSCQVPESAFQVKSKSAEVDVTFDSEAPGCYGWGYRADFDPETYEYTHSDWYYFGMITVQADFLAPGYESSFRYTEQNTQKDNIAGTSYSYRRSCSGGNAYNMLGGGFTMFGDAIFGDAYFPFETDEADGQYNYNKCSMMNK
jgi:hypothetical protein